ncbi:MAG: penicillin acylase family protein, partial [candidate division WOR-3 bacterium]
MAVFTFKLIRLEDGIPSIEGNSLQDVLTGLGYVHAQDRGIQMLLMRLLGRGRLAQSLAPLEEFIHWDIYFRRLTPSSEEYMELDSLSPQIHLLLQAYCKGVNEWFETHPIPKLLQLLGLSWWPWKTTDIFLVGKLIGYIGLAETQAYVERWIRDVIRAGLPVQMLDELFPGMLIGVDPELISKSTEASFSLPPHPIHDIELLPQGSNNWVVSGDHSISGYPILANDPHIQINYLPSIWYEVVLKWTYNNKSCYAAGISIPGIPGIVIGRTAKLAWGVTYACIDNTDSWIEKCKPGYYWKNNKWIPFTKRAEIIYRRCKSPIQVCFYENEHGTITEPTKWNELMVITRWAVSTKDSLHSIEALLNLLLAHTVREARTLLSSITNGAWNWVIADRTGHIGFQMSGIVPIRANGWSGLIPMPGWDKSWDWLGFASPEALPSCEDPPEGILITANNPMDHYGKIHCTSFTMGHYRASRIKDLLLQKEKLTVDDMLQIQLDVFSPQAALYMERIKPLLPFLESKYPYHVKTLQQWDCKYHLESKGAAI